MCEKIMVVDDDPSVLALMEIMLTRKGFSVVSAGDAQHALILLNQGTPDLFILDVMMPGMNGIELCRELKNRADTARTPVLILSAWSDSDLVKQALKVGADDCLQKTVMSSQVVIRVRTLLEQKSLRKALAC